MENFTYKRQYRQLDDATKQKISQSCKRLPPRSAEWKQHISAGLKAYWQGVPDRPASTDAIDYKKNNTTGDETQVSAQH